MISSMSHDWHLDDGDAMRWLDGEGDVEERRRLGVHLDVCAVCRRRVAELEDLSEAFAQALFELDEELLAQGAASTDGGGLRGRLPRWLNWRLAFPVVLVALLAVSPVRAWISGWWRDLTPGEEPVAAALGVAGVSFVPVGDTFTVMFASAQAGGTLVLRADTSAAVSIRPEGAAVDEIVVLPSGVLVRNRPEATAGYEVRVPQSVGRVLVRVEQFAAREVFLPARGAVSIPLVYRQQR